MKNKGYLTILLLLLGGVVAAKLLKPKKKLKGKVYAGEPTIQNAYSIPGSIVYGKDKITPIFTFRSSVPLKILDQDDVEYLYLVEFKINEPYKTGWILQNEIFIK